MNEPLPTPEPAPSSSYTGRVYAPAGPDGADTFYADVGELIERCADKGVAELPGAFTCTEEPPGVPDAEELIQQQLESVEAYEDAYDAVTREAVAEMQAFLNDWWGRCPVRTWRPTKRPIAWEQTERDALAKLLRDMGKVSP